MVGLSAEQYAGYLADRDKAPDIELDSPDASVGKWRAIRRSSATHWATRFRRRWFAGSVGGQSSVIWNGYIASSKSEDPDGLVTYVNYPSTEYLQLPFLDFVWFNVYLETEERLSAYLARLQNIAGDRPLLMSELGLDSFRNGERQQARTLEWQIRTTFAAGCTGAFVFSWTDEWYRGGADVDDWAFGLTDRDRRPKPALEAVQRAFAEVPFASATPGLASRSSSASTTVSRQFATAAKDSGSSITRTMRSSSSTMVPRIERAEIAAEYPFRLIRTPNQGLSSARNTGLEAATGEIVAYTDGDARPDPHWLTYLAAGFAEDDSRRYRRLEHRSRRRWVDRRLCGECSRRTGACAAVR